MAGTIAISSNEMFRGETVTGDAPAISAGVSFDGPGGFFAGASATVTGGDGHPRLGMATQYAGYAVRAGEVSIEAGLIHRQYSRIVDADYSRDFFEGYVGVTRGRLKARAFISTDYLRDKRESYYIEVNAQLLKSGPWSLDGHAGLSLIPHDLGSGVGGLRNYQDWRVQVSRPVGALFVTAGVAGTNYPVYDASDKTRAFVSASVAF